MDKQIIIDGCDVSGCEFAPKEIGWCNNGNLSSYCKDNPNCYYKQLKRSEAQCESMFVTHTDLEMKYKAKEQECEQLKREIDIKSCANIELSLEVKKYEKAIDEIQEIADNNYENPEMERIFNIIGGLDG